MKRLTAFVLVLFAVSVMGQIPLSTWKGGGPLGPTDVFINSILNGTDTFTNKTLTSPTITSPTITGTITNSATNNFSGTATFTGAAYFKGAFELRNTDADTFRVQLGADSLTAISLVIDDSQVFGVDSTGAIAASGTLALTGAATLNSDFTVQNADGDTLRVLLGTDSLTVASLVIDDTEVFHVDSVGSVYANAIEAQGFITLADGVMADNATFDDGASADTIVVTGAAVGDLGFASFTSDPGSPGAHWTVVKEDTLIINTDSAVTGTPTWHGMVFKKN